MSKRLCVLALVASTLCSCSGGSTADKPSTTTTAATTTIASETVEIPIEAVGPSTGRFASRADLEWAAAWMRWHKTFEPLYHEAESILTRASRRDAATAGTKDYKTLQRVLRAWELLRPKGNSARRAAVQAARGARVGHGGAVRARRESGSAAAGRGLRHRLSTGGSARLAAPERRGRGGVVVDAWARVRGPAAGGPLTADAHADPVHGRREPSRSEQTAATCFSRSGWRRKRAEVNAPRTVAGFVQGHGAAANLSPVVCEWLDRLVYRGARADQPSLKANAAQALLVLSHEAQHATGIRNEAKAECYGMQGMGRLGRLLRVNGAYADELAEFFWTYMYPYDRAPYKSPECRPGGKLDLHPRSSAWP